MLGAGVISAHWTMRGHRPVQTQSLAAYPRGAAIRRMALTRVGSRERFVGNREFFRARPSRAPGHRM